MKRMIFEVDISVAFHDGSPLREEPARVETADGSNPPHVMEARIEWGQGADGKQYPYVKFVRAEPTAISDEQRGA